MTMHPPADHRCQIYSEATTVRCINTGTHWVPWGHQPDTGEAEHYSWECDGEHLYGEAA